MNQSEQINELAGALAKAQAVMKNAVMNRVNPHFKSQYADLASVLDSIREPLGANGLAVSQTMQIREGGMVLRTVLMHTSGQWLASEYPLPAAARPQEMGSAQTYARRYSLAAIICNSADEDDDANGAEAGKQRVETAGKATTLPKKDSREIYTKMQTEIREWKSRDQGKLWLEANKDRVKVLPEDWQDILRLQCEEMLADLRNQEAA
jgi:hypothetical protein